MAVQQYALTGDGNGSYSFVTHYLTPAGNNAAGIAWSAAIVGAGLNKTILATGSGAGQISTADAAMITAGTLVEVQGTISEAPDAATAQAKLSAASTKVIADSKAKLQVALNYFGFTAGVAS